MQDHNYLRWITYLLWPRARVTLSTRLSQVEATEKVDSLCWRLSRPFESLKVKPFRGHVKGNRFDLTLRVPQSMEFTVDIKGKIEAAPAGATVQARIDSPILTPIMSLAALAVGLVGAVHYLVEDPLVLGLFFSGLALFSLFGMYGMHRSYSKCLDVVTSVFEDNFQPEEMVVRLANQKR